MPCLYFISSNETYQYFVITLLSNHDWLEIRDGGSANASLIRGVRCGVISENVLIVESSGNKMFVRFKSNEIGQREGYRLKVEASKNNKLQPYFRN